MQATTQKAFGLLAIFGSGHWLFPEVLEPANGAVFPASMAVLSGGLVVLSISIWGLHADQRQVAGLPSLVEAMGIGLVWFCLAIVDLRGSISRHLPR